MDKKSKAIKIILNKIKKNSKPTKKDYPCANPAFGYNESSGYRMEKQP
jgi:hypothetical protein